MRTMHDTIEDRVGEGRIAQMLMPAIARKLTRDDRGPSAIAVVEDLQQVLALVETERGARGMARLGAIGIDNRAQPQGAESFDGLFSQHAGAPVGNSAGRAHSRGSRGVRTARPRSRGARDRARV